MFERIAGCCELCAIDDTSLKRDKSQVLPSRYSAWMRNLRLSDRRAGVGVVFIVQGKPREAEGIVKVVKESREGALQAAQDLLDGGLPFVTIIGDGLVYSMEEFALTLINDRPSVT